MYDFPSPEMELSGKDLKTACNLPVAVAFGSNGNTSTYLVDCQKVSEFFGVVRSVIHTESPSQPRMAEALRKYGSNISEDAIKSSEGRLSEQYYGKEFSFEMYRVKLKP